MKEVVEVFFGIAVGLPLAIIGLIGLVAIVVASVASAATLVPRGRVGQAAGLALVVLIVLAMAFDVIPAGRLAGVPVLMVAAVMTFVTHQRIARLPEGRPYDIPIAVTAIAGLAALAVPVFLLVANGVVG